MPLAHRLPDRTAGILALIYLLFDEGYTASARAGLVRHGLGAEAVRLARALVQLMPDEAEAVGLLAASAGLPPEINPAWMLTPFTSKFILMM